MIPTDIKSIILYTKVGGHQTNSANCKSANLRICNLRVNFLRFVDLLFANPYFFADLKLPQTRKKHHFTPYQYGLKNLRLADWPIYKFAYSEFADR
jgi:hypothetical protein